MWEVLESLAPLVDWTDTHPVETWFIIACLAGAVAWGAWRYSARQNARSRAAGATRGFSPDAHAPRTAAQVDEGLAALPFFREGADSVRADRSKTVSEVLRRRTIGGEDLVFRLNDTVLREDADDAAVVEEYRVAAFRRDGMSLPAFGLAPEGTLSRMAATIGAIQDIELSDHPEFSRRYVLWGGDVAAAVDFLSGAPAECLAGTRGWYVQGAGPWLLAARRLRLGEGGRLGEFIDEAGRLARAFGVAQS